MLSTSRTELVVFCAVALLILVGSYRLRVYYRVTVVETAPIPAVEDLPDWVQSVGYLDRRGDHAVQLVERRIDGLVAERPELADRVWMLRLRRNGRPSWTEYRYEPGLAK